MPMKSEYTHTHPSPTSRPRYSYSLPSDFVQWLRETAGGEKKLKITGTFSPSGFSNNIVWLAFEDGRKVIVKQSQYDWAQPRFESSRKVSQLIRQESAIIAPKHLEIPEEVTESPTIAYWYLPFPTLDELWPELSFEQRKEASQSLGRMLREMHKIKISSYGPLHGNGSYRSASSFMHNDLQNRLKPAIADIWPEVLPIINQLTKSARNLADNNQNTTLVHNDIHLGNVLCEIHNGEVQCVGLLDLEEAGGGIWESDLASAITLHHPLFFSNGNNGRWLRSFGRNIAEGYYKKPSQELLLFFRIYHLVNLGFFSALNEHYEHAQRVAKKAFSLLDKAD